uniref:Inter-alpha-trypsin inhibitor heavy chain C-terminal domain-containing protein n=1 Tax=Xiphophorus couchianus TaxID=32473 RepID=A0A3B5LUV6_9TELE
MLYATPPPWVQVPITTPSSQVLSGPLETALPPTVNLVFVCHPVDGDPHFIIRLPGSNMDVCFNIDSKPGHILSLVSDMGTGVVVNGQLISSKQPHKNRVSSYFGIISVYHQPAGVTSCSALIGPQSSASCYSVTISIVKNSHVTVTIDNSIRVTVLLHRVWRKHPVNVDFLGLYIPSNNQYSPLVHGLIGQFSREPEVSVYDVHEGPDPLKEEATMEVKGHTLRVTRYFLLLKDFRHDRKRGSNVYCWFVHNSGKGFIDGRYGDYIMPDLNSFLQTV